MRKYFIILVMAVMLSTSGCIATSNEGVVKDPKKISVWWGNKEEIKKFLDSPEAQSEKWFVQSLGD